LFVASAQVRWATRKHAIHVFTSTDELGIRGALHLVERRIGIAFLGLASALKTLVVEFLPAEIYGNQYLVLQIFE